MPEKGGTTRRTRVHARDKDFTLYVKKRGLFTVLAPVGRYSDSMLALIAQDFLQKPDFLAVDLSRLDAVSLPLVRALCEFAGGLEPPRGRMVFVRPPDKIRALLKLVDRDGKSTITPSDKDLEGDLVQVEQRVRRAQERQQLVRAMLESNPCWQLVDAEGRWLCPFCVTLRPAIRFIARGSPTHVVIEHVAHHLGEECSTYTDGATDGWPFEVLERVITHSGAGAGEDTRRAATVAKADSQTTFVMRPPAKYETRRRHLLPAAPPSIEGCDVELYYASARPLSGDFYDFVRLPDRRAAIVVGDLSAHGVDPAVLMGLARKVFRIRLRECPDLAEALGRINDDLCEDLDQESYVTAAVALIDGARREMKVARAGHAAPFLVRAGEAAQVQRLESPGPLLGLVPTASFEEEITVQAFALGSGDILMLHSDGLEELRDPAGEKFGADRIAAILRAHSRHNANLILGALILEAEQFAGEVARKEDVTAVCVRFR